MNVTKNYQLAAETLLGHNGYGNVYLRLYVKYNSQSVEKNTTNVSIQARIYTLGGWWRSDTGTTYNIQASPNHTTGTVACNGRFEVGETTLGTLTKDISHNSDGTYKLSAEAAFVSNPWGWNGKAWNGNLILPTIARASSVSSSSPYIGDNATIIISSASTSFKHTLTYAFGNEKGTIATKASATTVAWDTNSIRETLYKQIPDAQEGKGTITCDTYSGDTLIGTKTCNFNLYAKKSDCSPDVSGTVVDTNAATIALTGDSSKLIRYMSKPKITVAATAKYSSSIKSYSINADGKTINANETTLDSIASNQITINATDSRGFDNPKPLTPEMVSYIKLNSSLTITRPEQTSNEAYLNGSGQWFNGKFNDSNANTLTIICQYRKSGESTWTNLGTITPTISGNTFSFSNLQLGTNFDYKSEYQFKITIADKLDTIGDETKDIIILSVGTPIVRIGKNKVKINGELTIDEKTIDFFEKSQNGYWQLENGKLIDSASIVHNNLLLSYFLSNFVTFERVNIGVLSDYTQIFAYKACSLSCPAHTIAIVTGIYTPGVSAAKGIQMTNVYNGIYKNNTDNQANYTYYMTYMLPDTAPTESTAVYLEVLYIKLGYF